MHVAAAKLIHSLLLQKQMIRDFWLEKEGDFSSINKVIHKSILDRL